MAICACGRASRTFDRNNILQISNIFFFQVSEVADSEWAEAEAVDGAGVVLLGTGTSLEPQSKSPVALTKVKSIALPRNAFMSLFASPNRKYRYRQRRNSTNGKNRTAHLVSNHIRGQISYSRRRNSSKGKRSTVMF